MNSPLVKVAFCIRYIVIFAQTPTSRCQGHGPIKESFNFKASPTRLVVEYIPMELLNSGKVLGHYHPRICSVTLFLSLASDTSKGIRAIP